jgi:hypothetical protein
MPLRPPAMLVGSPPASPPYSQSPSRRLGKPRCRGVGAVALRAVVQEQALPISRACGSAATPARPSSAILLVQRPDLAPRPSHPRTGRRTPARACRHSCPARGRAQVHEREHDGDVEQPHPPARQRVVVLGEVVSSHTWPVVSVVAARPAWLGLHLEEHAAGETMLTSVMTAMYSSRSSLVKSLIAALLAGHLLRSGSVVVVEHHARRIACRTASLRRLLKAHHTMPTKRREGTTVSFSAQIS